MFAKQHKTITVQALRGKISEEALRLVVKANEDSDTPWRRAGRYNVQHFHFPAGETIHDATKILDQCRGFINMSMEYASLCFLGGLWNEAFFGLGFYFMGRGLHCAQDYYAHSNGVAILHIDPAVVLDSTRKHPWLTFCTATTGDGLFGLEKLHKNHSKYGRRLDLKPIMIEKGELKELCRYYLNREYPNEPDAEKEKALRRMYSQVIRMMSGEPLEHPYVHLDFHKSFADNSLTALNRPGYRTAEMNAISLSKKLYFDIKALVEGTKGVGDRHRKVKRINMCCNIHGFKGDLSVDGLDHMDRTKRQAVSAEISVVKNVKREDKMRDIYNDCMRVFA